LRPTHVDGVEAQFTVYPEKVYGWMILQRLPATLQAIEEINSWLSARIARHPVTH